MYICICNAVTDKQIRNAVQSGCGTMRELRMELGVAGCCGKCAPDAKALLQATKLENRSSPFPTFALVAA